MKRKENRFSGIKTLKELELYSRQNRKSFLKVQETIKKQKEEYKDNPEVIEFLELQLDVLWVLFLDVDYDYRVVFDELSRNQ